MKALIVYESIYGNTRQVAEAIGAGFGQARVLPVGLADAAALAEADVLIVGAPTFGLGLSRPRTRRMAAAWTKLPQSELPLEPGAEGPGVREWLAALPPTVPPVVAVFDTRRRLGALRYAAGAIRRGLAGSGRTLIARPTGFVVGRRHRLLPGQLDRARAFGALLAGAAPRSGNHHLPVLPARLHTHRVILAQQVARTDPDPAAAPATAAAPAATAARS